MNLRSLQKLQTREKILSVASERLRSLGLAGASVAEVMKSAGLTVGGFYAHFDSKEDLIRNSFHKMKIEAQSFTESLRGNNGLEKAKAFFKLYLTPKHRDHPSKGCPLAALAIDLGRASPELRKDFAKEIEEIIETRIRIFSENNRPFSKEEILFQMSSYVGALMISRSVKDTKLSEEFLESTKKYLSKYLTQEASQ